MIVLTKQHVDRGILAKYQGVPDKNDVFIVVTTFRGGEVPFQGYKVVPSSSVPNVYYLNPLDTSYRVRRLTPSRTKSKSCMCHSQSYNDRDTSHTLKNSQKHCDYRG